MKSTRFKILVAIIFISISSIIAILSNLIDEEKKEICDMSKIIKDTQGFRTLAIYPPFEDFEQDIKDKFNATISQIQHVGTPRITGLDPDTMKPIYSICMFEVLISTYDLIREEKIGFEINVTDLILWRGRLK